MKSIYYVLIVIAVILIINEFVVFPIFPPTILQQSCFPFPFDMIVNRSELILMGIVGDSYWVTIDAFKGDIETHTKVKIVNIIKGSYEGDEIIIGQKGGCNVRLNLCLTTSIFSELNKNEKVLLFCQTETEMIYMRGFLAGGNT